MTCFVGGATLTFFGFSVCPPIGFCKSRVFAAELLELPTCPDRPNCRLILKADFTSGIGLARVLNLKHANGDILVRFLFLAYAREVSVAVTNA